MSTENQPPAPGRPGLATSVRMIATLGIVAVSSGLLIVFVYQGTLPLIQANQAERLQNAIFEVLPGAESRLAFLVTEEGEIEHIEGEDADQRATFFAGYDDDGNLVGVALRASAMGYQDVIRIIYGYDPDAETLIGYQVMENTETPGLGDRIATDSDFVASFEGLSVEIDEATGELKQPVDSVAEGAPRDDHEIDGIAGATISVDAVVEMLNRSLNEYAAVIREHRSEIEEAGHE